MDRVAAKLELVEQVGWAGVDSSLKQTAQEENKDRVLPFGGTWGSGRIEAEGC